MASGLRLEVGGGCFAKKPCLIFEVNQPWISAIQPLVSGLSFVCCGRSKGIGLSTNPSFLRQAQLARTLFEEMMADVINKGALNDLEHPMRGSFAYNFSFKQRHWRSG